jgi:3-isopropylmalate/(R)-2-methylmalate dehydratase small subunit
MTGRARVFGDSINTDYIISSRRKRESLDPAVLRQYLLEEIAPGFAASVQPGDILVAGGNFGCGSAMEVAVTAVLGAGIRAVLAPSFARTYFRNAINNGLLAIECDTSAISEGDLLDLATGASLTVHNQATGQVVEAAPMPPLMLQIASAGGLVPYFRQHGKFVL